LPRPTIGKELESQLKVWVGKSLSSKGPIKIHHPESAIYISEFTKRASRNDVGITINEDYVPEKFLLAFDIIKQEINSYERAEQEKMAQKNKSKRKHG